MNHIYLVGRPNVGKSYLFNKLSGEKQKVANYSGATVSRKDTLLFKNTLLSDLPGLYSFQTQSEDEKISLQTIKDSAPDDLICLVIESTKIKGQLAFALELRNWAAANLKPFVICINMIDEAKKLGITIDQKKLSEMLKTPVFFTSAKTAEGVNELYSYFELQSWSVPEVLNDSKNTNFLPEVIKKTIQGDFDVSLKKQNFLDRLFLAPFIGPFLFLILTFIIFQSIFTWASPFMDLIENGIGFLGEHTARLFPEGFLNSFVSNAIFAGFGAFLVFTPQIFILTFIIGFLEKSGYMARATTLCHKPLSYFGLTGKSFIPYMTGHACAIPAIYSARSIENAWVRNLTILTIPLTACSARLPVYALLIKILVPEKTFLFGLLGYQGLAFFLMYFFGVFMALVVSLSIDKFVKWSKKTTANMNHFFVMELPAYRWPGLQELISKSILTTWTFIKGAGPTIFIVNLAIWFLSYFPNGESGFAESYMVQIGKFLEPVFLPLGLNWIYGVAILTSFLAREVFVSTLGLLKGFESEDATEILSQVQFQDLSPAAAVGLLVFFAIALQCASTVGVLRKEAMQKSWAYMILFGYLVLAYLMSFITYQGLSLIIR